MGHKGGSGSASSRYPEGPAGMQRARSLHDLEPTLNPLRRDSEMELSPAHVYSIELPQEGRLACHPRALAPSKTSRHGTGGLESQSHAPLIVV